MTLLPVASSRPPHPLLLRRLALVGLIVACVALSAVLLRLAAQGHERARDAGHAAAWQSSVQPTQPAVAPDAVLARFNMKATGNGGDLVWQASSASELRASLRGLDAASIKLAQIKIDKRGSQFVVTAERAP